MFVKCRRHRVLIHKILLFMVTVIVLMFLIRELPEREITSSKQIQNNIIDENDENDEYEIKLRTYESKIIPNLGHNGKEATLKDPEDNELGEKALKSVAMNYVLSDRIPLNRSVGDRRNEGCKKFYYNPTLTASVVIIFYNEILSAILRTIWSVTLQTPEHLLHEIVLVDDASTAEELKGFLQYYIDTRLSGHRIKLHHLNERVGLIKARLEGAKLATGDVLIFLDAHCEATIGWIEPLLARIEESRSTVLTPLIDVISASNFAYLSDADYTGFQVGGFSWPGHFTWINVQNENDRGKLTPIKSPTMAGGLFAIERKYFWEIGSYDDKMEGWGGENLEISFRIWQCGGRLETVPCSRVGHIFRDFHPYSIPGKKDTHGINTARLAHVWMDDYKRLFFMYRPKLEYSPLIGDITSRLELRKRLKCKSFKWYLDNVFPEKFIPDENVLGYGQVRNNLNMCLDDLSLHEGTTGPLGLYPCHAFSATTQYFSMTYKGKLRSENFCAEISNTLEVQLTRCLKDELKQSWIFFKNGTIYNSLFAKCLSSEGVEVPKAVRIDNCKDSDHQKWKFTYINSTVIT
ncbi:hypothetical protein ILUMI_11880 [Ignelater luminosus]|uniref:Polypeptide N-acetylgalactosaminyltransferase n=1 Tax=Ignelater luminosus TaxID=2038154 RepID=A0A8K0D0M0_IGNLU|nr:hypothetical protein ILUMI_11880 [Ignelater luminosus]